MLMPHRIELFKDLSQVLGAYTLAFIISLNDFSDLFKCASFIVVTLYTSWKWRKEYLESKVKKRK